MAGFSYTREERELLLNLTKLHRDELAAACDKARIAGDSVTYSAVKHQLDIADSIINKNNAVA